MPSSRVVFALVALAALAGPALAKDKVVRVTLGPFRIEAKRDREVCQAVRIPKVPGMEVVSYEVRSLSSQRGNVGTHHMWSTDTTGPMAARSRSARTRATWSTFPAAMASGRTTSTATGCSSPDRVASHGAASG